MKITINIKDENGNFYEGEAILKKIKKQSRQVSTTIKKKTPSTEIKLLYQENYFSEERKLIDVTKKMKDKGYNFGRSSIYMALIGAEYLKQIGRKGKFRFIQKYPP